MCNTHLRLEKSVHKLIKNVTRMALECSILDQYNTEVHIDQKSHRTNCKQIIRMCRGVKISQVGVRNTYTERPQTSSTAYNL